MTRALEQSQPNDATGVSPASESGVVDIESVVEHLTAQLFAHENDEVHSAGCFADDAILVDARKLKVVFSYLAALEAQAEGDREALERIAHPEYGLGFNRLRGIARARLQGRAA